jgi:hypothetical protein
VAQHRLRQRVPSAPRSEGWARSVRAQASVRGLKPGGSSRLSCSSLIRRGAPSTNRVFATAFRRMRSKTGRSASHAGPRAG